MNSVPNLERESAVSADRCPRCQRGQLYRDWEPLLPGMELHTCLQCGHSVYQRQMIKGSGRLSSTREDLHEEPRCWRK